MFKKILVPIDSSENIDKVLECGEEIAKKFEAELIILTVVPDFNISVQVPTNIPSSKDLYDESCKRADLILEKAKEKIKSYDKFETVRIHGKPADEIIIYAEENGIDLIVMGNRGLGALSRMILGSVSNKVINHSEIATLVIKE